MLILFAKLGPMFVKKNVKFVSYVLFALYTISVDNNFFHSVFSRLVLDNTSEIVFHVFLMSYLYFSNIIL